MNLGNLLSEDFLGFVIESDGQRYIPYDRIIQSSVTYEVSHERRVFSRNIYDSLDFLSDIGGLTGALSPIWATIVFLFQYRGSYMYRMSQMLYDKVNNSSSTLWRQEDIHSEAELKAYTHKTI